MKSIFGLGLGLSMSSFLWGQGLHPGDSRADSLAIPHIHLSLDLSNLPGQVLRGKATLYVVPKMGGIAEGRFDLRALTIDSVKVNQQTTGFSLAPNHQFKVPFPNYILGDTLALEVYYGGQPVNDPAFGGFYFLQGYAYNIGVSLQEVPHNFAKTWYPCLDNFQTRSTYTTDIITQPQHRAFAGGVWTGTTSLPGGLLQYHYQLNQPIPPYLMSVAVTDYALVQSAVQSINGQTIPIELAARPADTTNFKLSAVNLAAGFQIFEQMFGAYAWDRVGYVLLPVTAGAMEHATNIAYPRVLANGSLGAEDVLIHELAHSWWGNLATCRTAEDMWLNEGWAVYCEWIFNEFFYSRNQYMNLYRSTHKNNLRLAHIEDGGHWPLSGVPQAHTYGYHSYSKGADLLHNLRTYLGDSLFFAGNKEALHRNRFHDWDAQMYRDTLAAITQAPLQDFFNDWIFKEGWPHVALDSFKTENGLCRIYLRQRTSGRSGFTGPMPLTLGLLDAQWKVTQHKVMIQGLYSVVELPVSAAPVQVIVNADEGLSDATSALSFKVKQTGNLNFTYPYFNLTVNELTDSLWLRITHHWTPADWDPAGNQVSPQRWWTVQMAEAGSWKGTALLNYNGRTTGNDSHLDHLLIPDREDSLMLLWRPHSGVHWTEYPFYTKLMGGMLDKFGNFRLDSILAGDYCFAMRNMALSTEAPPANQSFRIYPNPARPGAILSSGILFPAGTQVKWYDLQGKLRALPSDDPWTVPSLSPGVYIMEIQFPQGAQYREKITISD
jgi:aminopeptidase N